MTAGSQKPVKTASRIETDNQQQITELTQLIYMDHHGNADTPQQTARYCQYIVAV